ncbi:hypothetical protein BDV25DRAFT_138853 [Aspergillus avenaceus]|uniref:Uncharacterized protein n=1 Tax=Aspergillus avenaceus TaxID=36643 RepID=A0A5N6TYH2_ASPAV|nr:hypothetical protein BDV25DRAFT_138853 [Aspergillus avenaceus]
MEDLEPQRRIFDLVDECIRLYAERVLQLNNNENSNGVKILSDLNQRFVAWASFWGVFAESNICLDRRLRPHVEVQDQVLRLLGLIHTSLQYLFELDCSGSPGSYDARLASSRQLEVNVDNLEAISGAIKRLKPFRNCDSAAISDESNDKGKRLSLYTDASEGLLEQLTQSMVETYNRFLRRKSRQESLQLHGPRPPRPATKLHSITEEPDIGTSANHINDIKSQIVSLYPAEHPITQSLLPPSCPVPPLPMFEPTSVDTEEIKARMKRISNPSIRDRTKSILVNQTRYPRLVKGALTWPSKGPPSKSGNNPTKKKSDRLIMNQEGEDDFVHKSEDSAQIDGVDDSPKALLNLEVIAGHVAAHLQGIMLLTLRLISIDRTIDVSTGGESTPGSSDQRSPSWAGSGRQHTDQDMDDFNSFPQSNDDIRSVEDLREGIVPDSEYTDWDDIMRRCEPELVRAEGLSDLMNIDDIL